MKKSLLLFLAGAAWCVGTYAQQQATSPALKKFQYDDRAIMTNMSDNGKWATFTASDAENPQLHLGARLVDVNTGTATVLIEGLNADTIKTHSASDVTNDGNIVVGQLNEKPAYYTTATKKWTFLTTGYDNAATGGISCVTPDGHYAVGTSYPDLKTESIAAAEAPVMWDLTTGKVVPTNNLPKLDMAHVDSHQNRFVGISADGKKILGCMSYSFLPSWNDEGGCFYYVYDVEKQNYTVIGFTENDTKKWTPQVENLLFVSEARLNNKGNYVSGLAYLTSEHAVPFLYDVEKNSIKLYDDAESYDYASWVTDNEGNVFAAGPDANPYRNCVIRTGNYWVDIAQIVKQKYNIDIAAKTGYDNSGTPVSVSDDGLTLGLFLGDVDSYILKFTEPIHTTAANTNLLSTYTTTPADGADISKLSKLTVTFTRNVQVVGKSNAVTLRDVVEGTSVKSFGFSVDAKDPKSVNITFRKGDLTNEGMPYELTIPAKTICIAGDTKRYNDEITLTYNARANVPMQVVSSSPKENGAIGKVDMSTSPVTLTFDADIMPTTTSSRAKLYQDGIDKPVCEMMMAVQGRKLYVYPTTVQYLYKDVNYTITVPQGVVTDVTGNAATANQEFSLHLQGAYERELSYDSNILFSENFDNGMGQMMLYDGDTNIPSDEAKEYGFKAGDSYAWIPVRDDKNSSGFSAASNSMYYPEGTSNDWMVTPQINIMDKLCKLTFNSQCYRKGSEDSLKVIVWPSDDVYSVLSDELVERMTQEGVVVYKELQKAGKSESTLAGDWTANEIDLAQFAGKNVYIAFINQNYDQSIVFVDDIQVTHNQPFYVAFTNEDNVVAKESIEIGGKLTIGDEQETFNTLKMTLRNEKGEQIDVISAEGLNLKKGDSYDFKFNKAFPLTIGKVNNFTIDFKLNDKENSVTKSIRNLSFEPVKRVVVEEFTGQSCVNCPLGIRGMENLENYYGDLIIPMALHNYTGDELGAGSSAYSSFLGLGAAPSAIVQRSGEITYPITQYTDANNNVRYSFVPNETSKEKTTWFTEVQKEFAKPAQAEVTATATLAKSGKSYTVPVNVKYALNADRQNLKLFAVILENGLLGYQSNGFSAISDETLGEWGQGGKYGLPTVNSYIFDYVVRGTYGETFTGTPDLFPTTIEAGKDYTTKLTIPVPAEVRKAENTEIVLMLFDGNTDRLINTYKAKLDTTNGIEGTEVANHAITVTAANGIISVATDLTANVQVYSTDGRLIGSANGQGIINLNAPAHKGIAIVRVNTNKGVVVKKILL